MNNAKRTAQTFTDALNNPEAKALIESIEDMLSSWNGESRYASEIANCIDEIVALTGYQYTL